MKKLIRVTTIADSLIGFLKDQLTFLNQHYRVIGLASGKSKLLDFKSKSNIEVKHIFMSRAIRPFYDTCSLIKLILFFKKEKPHIVHVNTPKASLLSMLAASVCRVPHRIYTVTGLRFETTTGLFRKLLIIMEKLTCACATKVIPEGVGVKKTLINEGITKKTMEIILNGNINGIDTNYYSLEAVLSSKKEIRLSFGFEEGNYVFIFIGRLVGDKGINELVSAFIKLYNRNNNVRLLLVGRFENKLDPLDVIVKETIIEHSAIKHVGYQIDVRPFLKAADALVFPSYREGFPNVVMQAGAMELPSIVTNISGCNEIIIDGRNGVIIPPKDEKALLNKMKEFADHPDLVAKLAEQSRELIVSRYEQQKVWDALLEMYQNLDNQ